GSAAELAAALGNVSTARLQARVPLWLHVPRRRTTLFAGVAGGLALAGYFGALRRPIRDDPRFANADTTQLVVLPLRVEQSADPGGAHEALLEEAFARWAGIKLVNPVHVADALSRSRSELSDLDARQLANSLGAGRFVRARATRIND